MANNIIPDDLITTINDFKKSLNGQTISIHGKDYATVALRLAVARRNLGAKLKIETEIVSIDKDVVVVKAIVTIAGNVIATGLAEEKDQHHGSIKHQLLRTAKHLQLEER